MSKSTLALVARGPISRGQWQLEHLVARPIKDDEVLVGIVASGICRADIHFGDVALDETDNPAIQYPRILGHEGSGYIEEVGKAVVGMKVGDPCEDFNIGAAFFGQSSFAKTAIVKARSVVNVSGLGLTSEELQILAPLGCGIQTGAGAVTETADAKPHQDLAILGTGGVGQSAIMAAAMIGCRTIIAIDHTASRLELAKSLGATHTTDTSDPKVDLVAEVLKITGGRGVHVSLDTTGAQKLARSSWDFVRLRGKVLQVGLAKPADTWDVSMADHMNSGKQIIGCVQGDAIPQTYIRRMIGWYKKGKLPLEKIVKTYPADHYREAFEDMESGQTIKPILLWSDPLKSRI